VLAKHAIRVSFQWLKVVVLETAMSSELGSSEDIRVILWPQGLLVPVEMLGEMPSSRV
jgi:hypothetical protein